MKKSICLSLLLTVGFAPQSFALDEAVDAEIRRVEHRMMAISETNKQLLKDVRELQRENNALKKTVENLSAKYDTVMDEILTVRNLDVANLRAAQKGLYDQIPLFTWGEDTENCADIDMKHQQTSTIKSADGSQTMRYMCFDGKAIHLGTEHHGVPQ